jgi:hypothetical protein
MEDGAQRGGQHPDSSSHATAPVPQRRSPLFPATHEVRRHVARLCRLLRQQVQEHRQQQVRVLTVGAGQGQDVGSLYPLLEALRICLSPMAAAMHFVVRLPSQEGKPQEAKLSCFPLYQHEHSASEHANVSGPTVKPRATRFSDSWPSCAVRPGHSASARLPQCWTPGPESRELSMALPTVQGWITLPGLQQGS